MTINNALDTVTVIPITNQVHPTISVLPERFRSESNVAPYPIVPEDLNVLGRGQPHQIAEIVPITF